MEEKEIKEITNIKNVIKVLDPLLKEIKDTDKKLIDTTEYETYQNRFKECVENNKEVILFCIIKVKEIVKQDKKLTEQEFYKCFFKGSRLRKKKAKKIKGSKYELLFLGAAVLTYMYKIGSSLNLLSYLNTQFNEFPSAVKDFTEHLSSVYKTDELEVTGTKLQEYYLSNGAKTLTLADMNTLLKVILYIGKPESKDGSTKVTTVVLRNHQ